MPRDSTPGSGSVAAKASMTAVTPPCQVPARRITRPVSVQITSVSKTDAVMEMSPCSAGVVPSAAAAAIGAVPSPASLENTPRLTPACTAPSKPPKAASGRKAPSITRFSTSGSAGSRASRMNRQHSRYPPPISGTRTAEARLIRPIPPRIKTPAAAASTRPSPSGRIGMLLPKAASSGSRTPQLCSQARRQAVKEPICTKVPAPQSPASAPKSAKLAASGFHLLPRPRRI